MDEGQRQKEKKVFLSYLNDDNQTIATYVFLISKNDYTLTFRTKNNIITLQ